MVLPEPTEMIKKAHVIYWLFTNLRTFSSDGGGFPDFLESVLTNSQFNTSIPRVEYLKQFKMVLIL